MANFRSLCDRQTLSLMKAVGGELVDTNTFKAVASTEFDLLRSAAIYGPNAAGKSNFLGALGAMRTVVLGSATSQKRGDKLPVAPFRLSRATRDAPSEFEVTFIVNQVRYQYGFSASTDRIHGEWLLAFPKGRRQRWVDRAWNERTQSYDWELGSNLAGEKQLWQKSTRDNALFCPQLCSSTADNCGRSMTGSITPCGRQAGQAGTRSSARHCAKRARKSRSWIFCEPPICT